MRRYSIYFLFLVIFLSSTPYVFAQNKIIKNKVHLEKFNGFAQYILIKPENYSPSRRYPLFVFMHGLGSSPGSILDEDYELLARQKFFILIPQAPREYNGGFSWYDLKDEDQFIKDLKESESVVVGITRYVIKSYNINSSKVFLSGFSQGGRLCFYIGFRNPGLFYEIIPIGGLYMDDLLDPYTDKIQDLKISIFHGTKDDRNPFTTMQGTYQKLKQKGINAKLNTYPLGHTYTTEILEKVLNEVK